MKSLCLQLGLLTLWSGYVIADIIPIIRKEQKVVGDEKDKNYRYVIETANGIYQEEQGLIKNADEPGYETQVQQGQYQYVSPEGQVIQLQYTADEKGFVPTGAHIPTPPPVPKEIQKLLEFLATKKPDPADNMQEQALLGSVPDDSSFLDLPK